MGRMFNRVQAAFCFVLHLPGRIFDPSLGLISPLFDLTLGASYRIVYLTLILGAYPYVTSLVSILESYYCTGSFGNCLDAFELRFVTSSRPTLRDTVERVKESGNVMTELLNSDSGVPISVLNRVEC
jgi:hypothetical protein